MPSRTPQRKARGGRPPALLPANPDRLTPAAWWRIGVIVLAGSLVYANSLSGAFVLDDRASVVENASIRDWTSPDVLAAAREAPTAGRPVVNLSVALNYALGGLDPRGYHVWNVGVHLLCAMVLFGCIRRTLALPRLPDSVRRRAADIAFASTLLWTLHPLNTEVVDYVTQRSESMMAFFYLATIYASIRAGDSPRNRFWRAAAVGSCALGMMCKESMVTAPAAVWLYETVFIFGSPMTALRRHRRLYAGLAATWIVLAAVVWSGPRVHSAGFAAGVTPWTYLLNQSVMLVQYAKLSVWPVGLVAGYGPPQPLTLAAAWPHVTVVALAVIGTAAVSFRWPTIGFAGAWMFITLAPTSSIVPIATEVGAERRMYLPLAALVPFALCLATLLAHRAARAVAKPALVVAVAGTAALYAMLTMQRNRDYASPLRLAETVLANWPTAFAHAMVGTQLAIEGRHPAAIAELRLAAPEYPLARYHLGGELFNQGVTGEASEQLREFVRLEPWRVEAVSARVMIGRAEMLRSRFPDAIEQFRLVLTMTGRSNRFHTAALGLLADSVFGAHRFEEAVGAYRAYLAARPGDAGGFINLGISLARIGRLAEAEAAFLGALQVDPANATAKNNLAILADERRSIR